MFFALVLACGLPTELAEVDDCSASYHKFLLPTEEECIEHINTLTKLNEQYFEQRGWNTAYVQDAQCVKMDAPANT